jgi:hypothetical protein
LAEGTFNLIFNQFGKTDAIALPEPRNVKPEDYAQQVRENLPELEEASSLTKQLMQQA